LGGVSLIGVGALISVASHTTTSTNSLNQFFGVISAAVGSVLLVIGIGYLAMSYGLLKGRGWAWTITIILMFIGIAIQIISTTSGTVFNASLLSNSSSNNANTVNSGIIGGIIGIAINVAIVYYLYRPNVKAYFGKAHPPEIK
jgi:cytochrome bd-type quinol oxidase subunit 2